MGIKHPVMGVDDLRTLNPVVAGEWFAECGGNMTGREELARGGFDIIHRESVKEGA